MAVREHEKRRLCLLKYFLSASRGRRKKMLRKSKELKELTSVDVVLFCVNKWKKIKLTYLPLEKKVSPKFFSNSFFCLKTRITQIAVYGAVVAIPIVVVAVVFKMFWQSFKKWNFFLELPPSKYLLLLCWLHHVPFCGKHTPDDNHLDRARSRSVL